MKRNLCVIFQVLAICGLSVFSGVISASDGSDDDIEPEHLTIETAELSPTPKKLRRAIVRALLKYHWRIISLEKNQISAEYKRAILKVDFKENFVIDLLVVPDDTDRPMMRWLNNIKKHVVKELEYNFYIDKIDNFEL